MSPSDLDRRSFLARLAGASLVAAVPSWSGCAGSKPAAPPAPVPDPTPRPGTRGRLGDLETVVLRHASGSSAEIAVQGAHVTSWKRANGEELLFESSVARFATGEPIRGGIPVIFPQLGVLGSLPMHGLLRTATWDVADVSRDPNGAVFALFRTRDTDATRAVWPHAFRVSLRVTLDEALASSITVENSGNETMSFQCALHTYLRVGDVRQVSIEGLEGASYQDHTAKGVERRERRRPVRIVGEVNRIYMARPGRLRIRDESRDRTLLLDRAGFNDVVIWNPGAAKSRDSTELAPDEFRGMLAVEPAQIVPPVQLAPGSLWSGVQRMRVST